MPTSQATNFRFDRPGAVVVIGDIHGHYDGFVTILEEARLVDPQLNWIGGDTTLVQMGDLFGRGDAGMLCAELLQKLTRQAKAQDGMVITLVGNHEAMATHHHIGYIPDAELHRALQLSDEQTPWQAFSAALSPSAELGQWLRLLPGAIIINDMLFVHGGLEPQWLDQGLAGLNALVRSDMFRQCSYNALGLSSPIFAPNGPLWHRRWIAESESPTHEQSLLTSLRRTAAKKMIVAHTPSIFVDDWDDGQVIHRYDDRLIGVDLGINPLYGGVMGWVEIINGEIETHYVGVYEELAETVA